MGDQAACEFEERLVHVRASFPAHPQSAETVQPGKGPLDHPPVNAETTAVPGAAPCDDGQDAASTDSHAVAVVVVATVRKEPDRSPQWPADLATDGRGSIQQGQELGDIVAVAVGQDHSQRGVMSVGVKRCLEPTRARSTGDGPVASPPLTP